MRLLFIILTHLTLILACSRVLYYNHRQDEEDMITIGRSVDFVQDSTLAFWVFPRGLKRTGGVDDPFRWTSTYASTTAVMFDQMFVEGINERGLSASALFLGSDSYGPDEKSVPGMSSGIWMQYFLDTFETVGDIYNEICPRNGKEDWFEIVREAPVDGVETKIHLAMSDLTGDSLIMEYVKEGKLKCYHSKDYTVVAGDTYHMSRDRDRGKIWEEVKNRKMSNWPKPYEKYDRLFFFNHNMRPASDFATALGNTMGMIRAVSTPQIFVSPEDIAKKDLWPTQWRMYSDPGQGFVYYEDAATPLTFNYNLNDFDLTKNADIRVLRTSEMKWDGETCAGGNISDCFRALKRGQIAPFVVD
ncbi:choloylglycine hydrolase [Fusarium austroafricanum]|uniref:Choloylglycine hydrolase n=1 Tax=Fusarium austroafricanum TaxID=2364996 RepID=A0A8H4KU72_9HYPO|nr:choloylglycine hydrolase [Fusarium austroafricanum]